MNELVRFLQREDVKDFIRENIHIQPQQLILNPKKEFKSYIKEIADQIQARQKAKGKLDNWANNFDLIMPPPLSIEQASSDSTSIYKKSLVTGDRLIDLTGGMGIDCLALSSEFEEIVYVEEQPLLCDVFSHNRSVLKRQIEVVNKSADDFLDELNTDSVKTTFYIDPARRNALKNKVFKLEDCSPDILQTLPLLKRKAHEILIKLSPIVDIQSLIHAIPEISKIHIVSVKNECKEVLLLINNQESRHTPITAVNLESNHPKYSFFPHEENEAESDFSLYKKYLYEPNSSIMKSGAFKKIGNDFTLAKIASNTHLYTSDELAENFPGRIFEVISRVGKKEIKNYVTDGKINVIVRDYPLNANELKKKWKLKDGGDNFLIGFRDREGKAQTVLAKKINSSK